jgi:enoyl-CoA hydratase/carnithine racemase
MSIDIFQDILYEKDAQTGIVLVTINQPKRKNAMSFLTFMELCMAANEVSADPSAHAMLITGAKDPDSDDQAHEAFSSGGYFSPEESSLGKGSNKDSKKDDRCKIDFTDIAQKKLTITMCEMEKPVVVALNGLAIGAGFTMPLACADLIYASEYAWAQMPFIKIGIIPEFASSLLLPRFVGFQKAKELIFFGKKMTADQLKEMGLVSEVLPHDELLSYAKEETLNLIPPKGAGLAIRMTKRIMNQPLIDAITNALDNENVALNKAVKTKDFFEAVIARSEKRLPAFKGE